MKRRGWWGVGLLVATLPVGAVALAAERPLPSRSFEIESRRGSSRLVLSNDEREAVWAAAEETGYALNSIDLRLGRIRRVRDLVADLAQEESLLLPVPGRAGAYVFGVNCCSVTLGWTLWFVDRGDGELVKLTRDDEGGDRGDGSIVFSPSGRYFLAGTNFGCVGGGHSCSAGTVTVFSARNGKAEFVTKLPFEWEELEADPSGAPKVRRYPLGEDPAWCAGDVLKLAGEGGRAQAFVRGRDGRWQRRTGADSCSPHPSAPSRNTWPEAEEPYTITGRRVEVRVRGSGQGKVILDVSKLPPRP